MHILGDRLHASLAADFCDQPDHLLVDRILHQIADERAINLDVIDGQLLQVCQRAVALAEIIQRDLTTHVTQSGNLLFNVRQVPDCEIFGDFKHYLVGSHAILVKSGLDIRSEIFGFECVRRKVYGKPQ